MQWPYIPIDQIIDYLLTFDTIHRLYEEMLNNDRRFMINWFDYLHSIFNVPINMPGIDEKDFKDLGDSSYFSVSTDYSDDEMNNILN